MSIRGYGLWPFVLCEGSSLQVEGDLIWERLKVTTCGSVSAATEGDGYQLWEFVKVTIYGIGKVGRF
jgi:hypothetical protein